MYNNQTWIERSRIIRNPKQYLNSRRYPLNKAFKKFNGTCKVFNKHEIASYELKLQSH